MSAVVVLGSDAVGGTYMLRMQVMQDIEIAFGQLQRGKPILVPKGEMLYLGSAMRGLASRVLRHTLRSGDKPAHPLYDPLLMRLHEVGLINSDTEQSRSERFRPPTQKKLRWHVDYLLDETAVSLTHVILIRSEQRLEGELGEWLLLQPETAVLVPGLGASDVKGHTHLLRVQDDASLIWDRLLEIC